MTKFYHFNFNVLDLDRSLAFYKQALNLTPVREKEGADGSFKLVYLGDEAGSDFTLELTWLRDRTTPYDLGECEFHLAFRADDYDAMYEKHKAMGASVLRIPPWASISSPTRTGIGSRSCRRQSDGEGRSQSGLARFFPGLHCAVRHHASCWLQEGQGGVAVGPAVADLVRL